MTNSAQRPAAKVPAARKASRSEVALPGRKAAASVRRAEHIAVTLPVVGSVQLPRPDQVAYYAGIGALVALEVIEWPIALVLGVGHVLMTQQHNRTIHEFGEALEDA